MKQWQDEPLDAVGVGTVAMVALAMARAKTSELSCGK